MTPHHYPEWFPYCTSEYTLPAIHTMRDKAKAEGCQTRISYRGRHLAGDGTYQSFAKLYIRSPH